MASVNPAVSVGSNTRYKLSDFQQYEAWFFTDKMRAKYGDIWSFINPDITTGSVTEPTEPTRPTAGQDAAAQEDYKYELRKYEAKMKALRELCVYIMDSIE